MRGRSSRGWRHRDFDSHDYPQRWFYGLGDALLYRNRSTIAIDLPFARFAPGMSLCYELGRKGNGSEVNAIIASMLRLGIRDFRNSFESADAAVSGPNRELWELRKTGWLSQGQIAEANRSIEKLMHIMDVPEPNGRLYAVSIVLTPLSRRSDRSDEPTSEVASAMSWGRA